MKTLKESLFNKKILDKWNPYGISKKDMIGKLEGFPVGVVVRMMEEQELQENEPDVKVFQQNIGFGKKAGAFDWDETSAGWGFWYKVTGLNNFNLFFEKYPEYTKY